MPPEIPDSTLTDLLLWLARRRRRVRVTGGSMTPLLNPGDEVLIDPGAYRRRPPHPGDIVVARHPYRRDVRLIKRVAAVDEAGRVTLNGDNPTESTDSRAFGALPPDHIIGRVTSRFA